MRLLLFFKLNPAPFHLERFFAPIPSPFPIRGKGAKRLLRKRFNSPPHLWGRVWVEAKKQIPIWKRLGLITAE